MEIEVPTQEIWQVEANGGVFDATLDDIAGWIGDGSLLKIDRVRKGNLRWIEAGKVPALIKFFNAKDANEPPPPVITVSTTEVLGRPDRIEGSTVVHTTPAAAGCAIHTDAPVAYVCDTCLSEFCKACPSSYGSNVKICPFCGAMCSRKEEAAPASSAPRVASTGSFGFGDLTAALAFPFRFKATLILGGVIFAFFQVAGGGSPFGGIFMLSAGLICAMASNMITFAVLSHTVDSFAKGDLDASFMPPFDDFNIWDDVVHPFFLSIGVYSSSFGPFIAVVLFAFFFLLGGPGSIGSDAAAKIDPQYAAAPKIVNQGRALQDLAANTAEAQKKRVQSIEDTETTPQLDGAALQREEDERFAELDKMIQETRRTQLESAVGKAPETQEADQRAILSKVMSYGLVFVAAAGITLLWGFFYFPAACAVAGYTRSFGATINPTVGLDTIKRFGGSYFRVLLICLMLGIASGILNGIFGTIFSAFSMPSVGNLPAKILGSFTGFYFWIVFSAVLGFALYRNAEKLKLLR